MNTSQLPIYNACGNIIGIANLNDIGGNVDLVTNEILRKELAAWGQAKSIDSIMVLQGNPRAFYHLGYHYQMTVFEPKGNGELGNFSTMCGNGVRAVAEYVHSQLRDKEIVIRTSSGDLTIEGEHGQYTVKMGALVTDSARLQKYVNSQLVESVNGEYVNSPIPASLGFLKEYTDFWSIGFTTSESTTPDGEPHLVIQLPFSSLTVIKQFAIEYGQSITNSLNNFPLAINVNFIGAPIISGASAKVINVTHERNLGRDPHHSITQACGTGSTVVGGIISLANPKVSKVTVQNLGGNLEIEKRENSLFMSGGVFKVEY